MQKRLISLMLVFSVIFGTLLSTASAEEGKTSEVTLNQAASNFSVTVPTSFPVSVTEDGSPVVATDVKLINNSYGPCKITNVSSATGDGWSFVSTEAQANNVAVGSKKMYLNIAGGVCADSSSLPESCTLINQTVLGNGGETAIGYSAVVAPQTEAISVVPGAITFTVGWAEEKAATPFSLRAENLSEIGYNADSLGDVVIPSVFTGTDGNKYKVIAIEASAFKGKPSLTSVTIPDSVTAIEPLTFSGSGLESLTMSGNSGLNFGTGAFSNCVNLSSVILNEGLTTISNNAFDGCTSLTSITIPSSAIIIGKSAFARCSSLKSLTLLSTTSLKLDSDVLLNTPVDTINCAPELDIQMGQDLLANTPWYKAEQSKGTFVVLGSTLVSVSTAASGDIVVPDGVKLVGAGAFQANKSITKVTLPETVKTLADNAFSGCIGLKEINIDNVTKIGRAAFMSCESLDVVVPPGLDVSITSGNAFRYVKHVTYTGTNSLAPWGALSMN